MDVHVLEAHHCRVTLALLREHALLAPLGDGEEAGRLRRTLISSIISTDMAGHKDLVSSAAAMAKRLAEEEGDAERRRSAGGGERRSAGDGALAPDDRERLVGLLLHCADLSSPLQEADIDSAVTDRIFEEFAIQARMEREAGHKVTVLLAESRHAKASMEARAQCSGFRVYGFGTALHSTHRLPNHHRPTKP